MKTFTASVLCLLLSVLCLAGCATLDSTATTPRAFTPARLKSYTTVATALVLANNPRYVPALRTLNEQVESILTGGDVAIDAEHIARFVRPIGERHGLSPVETMLLTKLVTDVADYAALRLGVEKVRTSDAKILPFIRAFHDGVADAITLQPAS
jgi:hypothetical protein